MNAALNAPVPPRLPGTNGRPRLKGKRLPRLGQVLRDQQTTWQQVCVWGHNDRQRAQEVTSSGGMVSDRHLVLPVRWGLMRES
jgi:hypothetical protein